MKTDTKKQNLQEYFTNIEFLSKAKTKYYTLFCEFLFALNPQRTQKK